MSVVDLPRILAADARLAELVARWPSLLGRAEALDDDLGELLEDEMADGVGGPVPVKLPPELLARADELIAAVEADRELGTLAGGRVSRAAVVRLALLYGLEELERRLSQRARSGRE